MAFQFDHISLAAQCEIFIRAKRNFNTNGHQRRYLFNVTSPFVDADGLIFTAITNSPYDYLDYAPTLDHVFLNEPTLQDFERYVDIMFDEKDETDDWCYFKIFKKLLPEDFQKFTSIIQRGKYRQSTSGEEYKVPICMIPIAEYHLLEEHSSVYSVKGSCLSLERSHLRLKLNSYFHALMTLLNCSEEDIVEVLCRKGVLPSKDFQLISTQKELTIAFKRYKSSGDTMDRLGDRLKELEATFAFIKPKYGMPNTNLCQALQTLFATHPLYLQHHRSLLVETVTINGGKGHLQRAIPNKKRKYTDNQRDQSCLPKKLAKGVQQTANNIDILADAMLEVVPERYLPPGRDYLTFKIDLEFLKTGGLIYLSEDAVPQVIFEPCVEPYQEEISTSLDELSSV